MHKNAFPPFRRGVHHTNLGISFLVAIVGVASWTTSALAGQPPYRIIVVDLPVTDDIVGVNPGMGINGLGEGVGTAQDEFFELHPFAWLPTANYGLAEGTQLLQKPIGGSYYQAFDININGIVVGTATPPDDGPCQAISTTGWVWELPNDDAYPLYLLCGPKNQVHAINDAVPPVVVGNLNPGFVPTSLPFRMTLGGAIEVLGLGSSTHDYGSAVDVSNTGLVIGSTGSNDTAPACGKFQHQHAATVWKPTSSAAGTLGTLWDPAAVAHPRGVSNSSPSMIVGYGQDPGDAILPCRTRALFWVTHANKPIALPYLTVNGQPLVDQAMLAEAVNLLCPSGEIHVVGRSESANAAVLWRHVNAAWEAIDLNTIKLCGGEAWAKLTHAEDINDKGWIIGRGTLLDGSPRAFILIPTDHCPGDIVGSGKFPDRRVDDTDLAYLLSAWGTSDCLADLNGDGIVNYFDLSILLGNWGPCHCYPE